MKTIQVVLDSELLHAVDDAARRARVNRSALVRQALREHLRRLRIKELEARERRAYQEQPQDIEEVERWERKLVLSVEPAVHSATPQEKARILAQLKGNLRVSAFDAANWVWHHPDPDFVPPLIDLLSEGRRPFNRAAAAYALQPLMDPRVIPALERVVANQLESPSVRGFATEALAHFHRKRSHMILIGGLKDRSKEVRFWCAFALGEMRDRAAVSVLQQLMETDTRMIPGFHTVAEEAGYALRKIAEGGRRGCSYCIGQKQK